MNSFHALLTGSAAAILPTTPAASAAWDIFVKESKSWGFMAVVFILLCLFKWRTKASLQGLAERLGYEFKVVKNSTDDPFYPLEMAGSHRGREVRFYAQQNPAAKYRVWVTMAASISANKTPTGAFLYIAPNTWSLRTIWRAASLSATKKLAIFTRGWEVNWKEMQDLATGDEIFDRAFLVSTNYPGWAKMLLTQEVRQTLLAKRQEPRLLVGYQNNPGVVSLCIQAGEVRYSVPEDFSSAKQMDYLVTHMDFICDVATQAEGASPRGLTSASAPRQSLQSSFPSVEVKHVDRGERISDNPQQAKRSLRRVIAAIAIFLVSTLLIEVVPAFEKSYDTSHVEPPVPMQALIDISHFLGSWWWILMLGAYAFMNLFTYAVAKLNKR